MDIEYIREIYDAMNVQAFEGVMTVYATVHITAYEVRSDSVNKGFSGSLDATFDGIVKKGFPDELSPFYRVRLYKISDGKLSSSNEHEFTLAGQVEPCDIWVSCFTSVVSVRDRTIFDYASDVDLLGDRYKIKSVVSERFGNKGITHVFLDRK